MLIAVLLMAVFPCSRCPQVFGGPECGNPYRVFRGGRQNCFPVMEVGIKTGGINKNE